MNFDAPQVDQHRNARHDMVERVRSHGVRDRRLLDAMREVPRHSFEPDCVGGSSYQDCAWPISAEHTVSSPYYVARACELAEVGQDDRVLVIGAGAGFSAAVLSKLCRHVVQLELIEPMAEKARHAFQELGIQNVSIITRHGHDHVVPAGPYDAIVLEAGVPQAPRLLVEELAHGGRLVMPVGRDFLQTFVVLRKTNHDIETKRFETCIFEPLRRNRLAPQREVPAAGELHAAR